MGVLIELHERAFSQEGLMLKAVPERSRWGDDSLYLDVDLLDEPFMKEIGTVCARFGLVSHWPRYYLSKEQEAKPPKERNYSDQSRKIQLANDAAIREMDDVYANGHNTVFDLIHHYFTLRAAFGYGEGINPAVSLDDVARELIERAPLQAFYTHHRMQRYVTPYNLHLADAKGLAERVMELYDLFALSQYVVSTESDFCELYEGESPLVVKARRLVKDLSEEETVITYEGETNGELWGEFRVPKPPYYDLLKGKNGWEREAVMFPEMHDDSRVGELFMMNIIERSYLLHEHPERFTPDAKDSLKKDIMAAHPSLAPHEGVVDVLLVEGNYPLRIQARMLAKKS